MYVTSEWGNGAAWGNGGATPQVGLGQWGGTPIGVPHCPTPQAGEKFDSRTQRTQRRNRRKI